MSENQDTQQKWRFECPHCRARYAISPERVQGVEDPRFQCKRCGAEFRPAPDAALPADETGRGWKNALAACLVLGICLAVWAAQPPENSAPTRGAVGALFDRPDEEARSDAAKPSLPAPQPAAETVQPPAERAADDEQRMPQGEPKAALKAGIPSAAPEVRRTFAALNAGALRYSLQGSGSEAELKLAVKCPRGREGAIGYLQLSDPPRAVIDVPALDKAPPAPKVSANPFVKAIRVGHHPVKTRLVLDLTGNASAERLETSDACALALRFQLRAD